MSDTPAMTTAPAASETSGQETSNNNNAAQESNAQGAKTQASKAQEAPKKFVVKIDGKETEVDEAELKKGYQLAKASYQKMAEAHKMKQDAEKMRESIESDPLKYLKSSNKNIREIAEKYLYEELQKEQLSPEQKRILELEAKIKEEEDRKEQERLQEQDRQYIREQQEQAIKLDKEMTEGLSKANLPKTAHVVGQIAFIMESYLQNGIDLSVDEAISYYQDSYDGRFREHLSTLEGDRLLEYLGKDIVGKIRKADVGRIKNPIHKDAKSNEQKPASRAQAKLTMSEFLENLEKSKRS